VYRQRDDDRHQTIVFISIWPDSHIRKHTLDLQFGFKRAGFDASQFDEYDRRVSSDSMILTKTPMLFLDEKESDAKMPTMSGPLVDTVTTLPVDTPVLKLPDEQSELLSHDKEEGAGLQTDHSDNTGKHKDRSLALPRANTMLGNDDARISVGEQHTRKPVESPHHPQLRLTEESRAQHDPELRESVSLLDRRVRRVDGRLSEMQRAMDKMLWILAKLRLEDIASGQAGLTEDRTDRSSWQPDLRRHQNPRHAPPRFPKGLDPALIASNLTFKDGAETNRHSTVLRSPAFEPHLKRFEEKKHVHSRSKPEVRAGYRMPMGAKGAQSALVSRRGEKMNGRVPGVEVHWHDQLERKRESVENPLLVSSGIPLRDRALLEAREFLAHSNHSSSRQPTRSRALPEYQTRAFERRSATSLFPADADADFVLTDHPRSTGKVHRLPPSGTSSDRHGAKATGDRAVKESRVSLL
jgi:hypothetical protein